MTYPYEKLNTFTLPVLLKRSISLYSDEPALANIGEKVLSYSMLGEKIEEMVQLLQINGINKGDKVVLLSENMPNWAVAYFSITYFGAVVVPVLPDFHPSDVQHIIRHSEAKAVFVSEKYLPTVEECENSNVKFVIKLNNLLLIDSLTNHSYISKLTSKISQKISQISLPLEDDIASLLYTSGTTGHSKGVMLSHKNLVTNAMSAYKNVSITKNDVFLSILPLAHTLECTVGLTIPILHGSSVYYINKTPTPSVLLKAFSIVRPTMMISVPLIIEKIYKKKVLPQLTNTFIMRTLYSIPFFRKKLHAMAGKKLLKTFGGRLKFFGIGGAGISPYVEEFLQEANFPYIIGYGLTETAPLLAGSFLNGTQKLTSTGVAMVGIELSIKDKNPLTGEGEIIAKGPNIMLGYYKDKEKTDEVIQDGWFLTGDLGYIDEDGFLFIRGRSKNVIIGLGGENIYPEQIEATINKNETVLDSLIIQRDAKLVALIHLDYEFIEKKFKANKKSDTYVKEQIDFHLEEMRLDVNSQIASFCKMVKFIEQIEPFVKTPTKKIKRYLYVENS